MSATRSAPHRALSPQCKALSPAHPSRLTMPMIDIYAPADLFPAGTEGLLGKELTIAVLLRRGCGDARTLPPEQHRRFRPPDGSTRGSHRGNQLRPECARPGRAEAWIIEVTLD